MTYLTNDSFMSNYFQHNMTFGVSKKVISYKYMIYFHRNLLHGKSNLSMMKIFKYFRVLRIDILTIQRISYHDAVEPIEVVGTTWWRYIRSIIYINTQLITLTFLSINTLSFKFKSCMIHKIPVITAIKK